MAVVSFRYSEGRNGKRETKSLQEGKLPPLVSAPKGAGPVDVGMCCAGAQNVFQPLPRIFRARGKMVRALRCHLARRLRRKRAEAREEEDKAET